LHDAIIGERLGLPAVGIMTSKFVSAAELMARVLGAGGYRFVEITHPISSASPREITRRALDAAAASAAILLGQQ
jgi:2-keto-3-deoxy-6-phosphogluconate aldolase